MTYDPENRMVSTNAGVSYSYDGDGRRVKKGTSKLYWYGAGSDVLLETATNGANIDEFIFFGGKRVARHSSSGAVFYYFSNHLGSTSVITSSTGSIVEESDYYPFGGERIIVNNDPNQYKFTGKERDTESGLDYFVVRYYASSIGRFVSRDPMGGTLIDPQSLNRYTYVLNNPLKFVDPTGMVVEWADSKKTKHKGETTARTEAQRKYEQRIQALKNSRNPAERARGAKLEATYRRLQESKEVFRVVRGDQGTSSSGDIRFDGENYTITLKGSEKYGTELSDNQKLAHEFEHGRQVLDKELVAMFNPNTESWVFAYADRTDEALAFQAGFDAERASPAQGSFLKDLQTQLGFGIKAAVDYLGRSDNRKYRKLPAGPLTQGPKREPPQ